MAAWLNPPVWSRDGTLTAKEWIEKESAGLALLSGVGGENEGRG